LGSAQENQASAGASVVDAGAYDRVHAGTVDEIGLAQIEHNQARPQPRREQPLLKSWRRRSGELTGYGHPGRVQTTISPRANERSRHTTASQTNSARPRSPHLDHAPGWRGSLHGLGHAHVGWMLRGKDMANPARYAKDLLDDRDLRFISRTFPRGR
jgi:hypothetical protein